MTVQQLIEILSKLPSTATVEFQSENEDLLAGLAIVQGNDLIEFLPVCGLGL